MVDALRIVFFGTPQFAIPTLERLLRSAHTVVGVFTQPDRPRGRGQRMSDSPVKRVAVDHSIPVFQPSRLREADVEATLRGLRSDLGVVAAYGKLIPDSLLDLPRFGMINVHASLLPKYRGAAPVQRAVMAGERETGVTIMRVIRQLDAGGMFAKVVRPIDPDETSDVLERALSHMGAELLGTVVDQLAAGIGQEEPQDESQATYAPRLTKSDGLIDWSLPARDIHNRVRGLHPWPHAHSFLGGARLIIRRTVVVEASPPFRSPGTVVRVTRDAIHVATGCGTISLAELQPEGGRPMNARDFLAGHRITCGAMFESS
jgi:methionyl-tRNA formyltransferase